jgi:hypothetical protein
MLQYFFAKVGIENFIFNFPHFEGQISVNIKLAYIKVKELDITH